MFESTLRYSAPFDKDPVLTHHSKYDSLMVRSHLLAYASKSVPKRIHDLVTNHGVEFYIEPMVWDFRAGTNFRKSNGNLKAWHAAYADALGDTFSTTLQTENHVDAAQMDDAEIKQVSEAVVDFQEQFLIDSLQAGVGKYEDIDVDHLVPKAVIPWIHKLAAGSDIPIFNKILKYSVQSTDLTVKPCIYVTKEFIRDVTNRSTTIEVVDDLDIESIFLWVDNLDKRFTTERNYRNLIDFVHEIHSSDIRSHMFYGDYFSNLLSFFGLGGTVYGTNFGEENQEQLEEAGGGMIERYYVNETRDFLKAAAAVDIQQRASASVCTCDGCDGSIDTWDDITRIQADDDLSLLPILQEHFICMKEKHAEEIYNNTLDDLLTELENNQNDYSQPYSRSVQISPSKQTDHLLTWKDAIDQEKAKAVQDLAGITI